MKTMSFLEKDKFFILVHGEAPPSDPEWEAYVAALGKHSAHVPSLRVLVVSRGGGPSMGQRKRLKDVLGSAPLPTAVITTSPLARTIVTIIRLTSPEIAAFSPEQKLQAYRHLGFADADTQWLEREVAQQEREITGTR
jgi:hypothetical protein